MASIRLEGISKSFPGVKALEDIQKLQTGQAGLDEQTVDQIRTVTWDNMIQDLLLEKQYEKLSEIGIPDEARAYLGMMGFRIIINVHGDIIAIDQPGVIDSEGE